MIAPSLADALSLFGQEVFEKSAYLFQVFKITHLCGGDNYVMLAWTGCCGKTVGDYVRNIRNRQFRCSTEIEKVPKFR